MSWGKKDINTYRACDAGIIITVKDENGDPFEFVGDNVIRVFHPHRKTPEFEIDLTWDSEYGIYTGMADAETMDVQATVYRYEWINSNDTRRPILTGRYTVSDVYTDNRAAVDITLTVDAGGTIRVDEIKTDVFWLRERDGVFALDKTITATGFSGDKGTDWGNIIEFNL